MQQRSLGSNNEAVAQSLYAPSGEQGSTGLLYRLTVPISRAFMTHCETAAMNARYQEAEAVLLFDPGSLCP